MRGLLEMAGGLPGAARRRFVITLLGFAAATGGCAEPPFSLYSRDNDVGDIRRAMAPPKKLAPAVPPAVVAKPMAYLVTAPDRRLVAYDLQAAQVLWDVPAEITSRLAVGRGFLAHRQGPRTLTVRASSDGQVRCRIELRPGEQFLGLAADDRLYYVVQSAAGTARTSDIVAVSADSCATLWRDPAMGSLGAPTTRGGLVVVPFAYQSVVLLDGQSGAELARVRATDEAVTFVQSTHEGLFYGDNKGVYLLNDKSAAGSKKGSAYAEAHLASSQIRTFYYWNAYHPSQADYTAFDRNRLLWRAEPSGDSIAFHDASAYLHSYRFFFSFDTGSGDLRWAYAHPRVDLVASDDTGPSILFASAEGEVGALDAKTGAPVWSKPTGLKLAGATFDADGFAPGSAPGAPLAKTLASIVWDPDARFTAVKVFAVAAMTRVPGEEVTAELVKLVTRPGLPPPVAKAASEALVARRDATSRGLYRQALALRSDYLADQRAHGVDVLARVVAVIEDREAAPLLAAHLLDPATPLPAVKEIVKALVELGGAGAVGPLRDLLLTYRADAGFLVDPASLQLAGDGLLKLGGAEGRRLVAFVAEEARTLPAVATYLRRALDHEPRGDGRAAAPVQKEARSEAALRGP